MATIIVYHFVFHVFISFLFCQLKLKLKLSRSLLYMYYRSTTLSKYMMKYILSCLCSISCMSHIFIFSVKCLWTCSCRLRQWQTCLRTLKILNTHAPMFVNKKSDQFENVDKQSNVVWRCIYYYTSHQWLVRV